MEKILAAPRVGGLPPELLAALAAAIRGSVYDRGHPSFAQQTRLWNGNLVCAPRAVASPVDAADVS
jgi:hypothetical protein